MDSDKPRADWSTGEYWQGRFDSGDTPWELNAPSKVLFEAVSRVFPGEHSLKGLSALSPGCGSGCDALELARRGASVVALDWSKAAASRLKDRLTTKLDRDLSSMVRVVNGDFFATPPTAVDLICEHTFFCAIDPSMRGRYKEGVLKWLKRGGYLIGNFFVLSEDEIEKLGGKSLTKDRSGPPFGSTERELIDLFSIEFDVLDLSAARDGEPNRKPGLEWTCVFKRR
jgi:hypothetical protein